MLRTSGQSNVSGPLRSSNLMKDENIRNVIRHSSEFGYPIHFEHSET